MTSDSSDFDELAANIPASVVLRIPGSVIRRVAYGRGSARFLRGRLDLFDQVGQIGKPLWTLAARDGHVSVEAAFDRVLDELAERYVTSTQAAWYRTVVPAPTRSRPGP